MRTFLWCGLTAGILLCIAGCHKKTANPAKNFTVITAAPKATVTALHFSGTLAPLTAQSVLSPLDGRVTQVLFHYGQQIQQGQPLITLDAGKLAEDYRKAVSDFLEKKQSYASGQISYQGTEALYKAGVISQEEYFTASNRQKTDTLSYYQAKYDLEKLLAQTGLPISSIEELDLNDMKKVTAIVNRKFQEIKVLAAAQGVALFPSPEQKKDSSGNGRISVGDEVKAGQLILSIGDLSGFSMNLNVSEISINLIKPHLAAKITGDAFPGIELAGHVESVAAQANPQNSSEGGLGMFEVVVKIPAVSAEQQRVIHVGMSAKAQLDIPQPPQIFLPIKAVYEKDGQRMVTIVTKSGEQRAAPVITGATTLSEVAIVQGIHAGDRVVVPH